jgi:S-DNA-T family DNA segregation ATPase FtsK/SpoIIIE
MAKRRRKKKKPEKKPFKYGVELNGLLFFLLAIIGIPPFGLVGTFIKNFAMFLMGNANIILLVMFLYLGLYMMFKRSLPEFFSGRKIGIYLLIIVVLTYMHISLIDSSGFSVSEVFTSTLDNFKDAISNSDGAISVGGGFIGAFFSWAFINLFALQGSKIILVVLGIFGIIMLFEIDFAQVVEKIKTKRENRPVKEKKSKEKDLEESEPEDDRVIINSVHELTSKSEPVASQTNEIMPVTSVEGEGQYIYPSLDIFDQPKGGKKGASTDLLMQNKAIIEQVLNDFQLYGKVVNIHEGPAVTQYEVEIKAGTKLSRITSINKEIALALAAKDVRIMAPIPGKSTVGIEIPNKVVSSVPIREVLANIPKHMESSNILVVLGKDLMGNVMTADLSKMPHLLVAGSTGSGKSVCINSFIASILMRYSDDQVKLILIDPKKVELSNYKNIPHLMYPVVTDPKQANVVLKKLVEEMERRYAVFSEKECKNIATYNEYIEREMRRRPDEGLKPLPYIVAIIDELADLMLVAAKEVEDSIMRITQMARAAGIHLIVATQRPSTDVITGIVKANIPSRLSFAVSSGIDSRTILDMQGAEKLLGKGDMLYLPMGENSPIRIQGTFISDDETKRLIEFITSNRKAHFDKDVLAFTENKSTIGESDEEYDDPMYDEIVEFALRNGKISASLLQRKFRLGFNRAARIVDLLEERGIVGPQNGSKPREVLIKLKDDDE